MRNKILSFSCAFLVFLTSLCLSFTFAYSSSVKSYLVDWLISVLNVDSSEFSEDSDYYYDLYYHIISEDWWGSGSPPDPLVDSDRNFTDSDYIDFYRVQFAQNNLGLILSSEDLPVDWDILLEYIKKRYLGENYQDISLPDCPPLQVDSGLFKEAVTESNSNITPKNHFQSKLSYRTDPYWYDDKAPSSSLRFTVYDGSGFCPEHYERTNGVYLLPFYEDGEGMKYFAYYQYHLYFEPGTDDNEGKCRVRADIIGLDFAGKSDVVADASFWWFDGTSTHVFGSTYATWTDVNPYFDIGLPFSDKPYLPVSGYINFSDYISRSGYTYSVCRTPSNPNNEPIGKDTSFINWISYDKSSTFDFTTVFDSFLCPRSEHSNLYDDIGFIVSSDPIVTQYVDIDVGQLPDNQIITISGDTIYDYSITNPSTGETTTVNNYITNNYTYPEGSGSGDTSGSSGGASTGDVNVGGNVIVGGEVGINGSVDININVNSGSTTVNPDDFTSAENVDLTKYYDSAIDQSTGFQKFLKDFFGFLPAELLGLILFAVAIAIICRVFGR